MKVERRGRQCRTAGRRWKPAAIILAAVLAFLSLPFAGKTVFAVDLERTCALTVNPGSVELAEDLAGANVVIDLYRVADAVPVSGYDTYDWAMTEPFSGITIDKDINNAGWKTAAQQAAQIVLGDASGQEEAWDPAESIQKIPAGYRVSDSAAGTKIEPLQPGLYLVIAHGSDLTKYAVPKTADEAASEDASTETASAGTEVVTIANSRNYQYSFAPELVSLPSKAANSDGVLNTANAGDWIYDALITLKPSQEVRVGALDIVKELVTYEEREKAVSELREDPVIKDQATFIFDVSVYNSEEEYKEQGTAAPKVYHDQVSIVFDSYGTKRVHIGELPVDSYAVVTEIYPEAGSGVGHYKLIESDGEKTIIANETVEATFKNDYNNENNGGGSVTNKFTYKEDQSKWGWEQVTDDSTDGAVIQSDEKTETAE